MSEFQYFAVTINYSIDFVLVRTYVYGFAVFFFLYVVPEYTTADCILTFLFQNTPGLTVLSGFLGLKACWYRFLDNKVCVPYPFDPY